MRGSEDMPTGAARHRLHRRRSVVAVVAVAVIVAVVAVIVAVPAVVAAVGLVNVVTVLAAAAAAAVATPDDGKLAEKREQLFSQQVLRSGQVQRDFVLHVFIATFSCCAQKEEKEL